MEIVADRRKRLGATVVDWGVFVRDVVTGSSDAENACCGAKDGGDPFEHWSVLIVAFLGRMHIRASYVRGWHLSLCSKVCHCWGECLYSWLS